MNHYPERSRRPVDEPPTQRDLEDYRRYCEMRDREDEPAYRELIELARRAGSYGSAPETP